MAERHVLLIGYGNDLRGDDAVGRRAAEAVSGWGLPRLRSLSQPQLAPELAPIIADATAVIFVDASLEVVGDRAMVLPVVPSPDARWAGHASSPQALLELAQRLYHHAPPAWCVHIPAGDFELGMNPSPRAQRGLESGLQEIRLLYDRVRPQD